ncbi:probable apyrase 7 [Nymphaea colorata]|nr:probable apyrase 7 [Nymphaea colorata]
MRLSSSLQDLSTYSNTNIEDGHCDRASDTCTAHPKFVSADVQREIASSSFSKEKGLPSSLFTSKKWMAITTMLFCIFLFVLSLYICARYFNTFQSPRYSQYSIILDSGSTGTRVYVYEWLPDKNRRHGHLPLSIKSLPKDPQKRPIMRNGRAYHRMETEPGFDKLVHNISRLKSAIHPLIQWAEKQVPKGAHRSTPLYLYATAGLRRLPSADSKWLLDNAWKILKGSSFICQRGSVKIISGMEEAYYGWIALNYKMKTLGFGKSKSTFGSLDLGGSSLQVTFETQDILHGRTSLNLSIGEAKHHLSAYSLSGYGLNDAFDKSVVFLLNKHVKSIKKKTNDKIALDHPCLHTGYRERYACRSCAVTDQGGIPLADRKTIQRKASGITVELHGLPDWEGCVSLAKSTVNLSEWFHVTAGMDCSKKPCALTDDLPQPFGQFFAMSGFFVVFKFFNLTSKVSLNDVMLKGHEFCSKTWEVAKNSVAPQPFIEQYCFRAPYIVSLLRDGLHIDDNRISISSGSITWTLGVALTEAGKILSRPTDFQGYSVFPQKFSPAILITIMFISLAVIVALICYTGKGDSRCFHGSYLPLALGLSGDGRVKTPLSPTAAGPEELRFGKSHGLSNANISLIESLPCRSIHGVAHSFSTSSLGQMPLENNGRPVWLPHRSQMRFQSRRTQSREDLSFSFAEAHMGMV